MCEVNIDNSFLNQERVVGALAFPSVMIVYATHRGVDASSEGRSLVAALDDGSIVSESHSIFLCVSVSIGNACLRNTPWS